MKMSPMAGNDQIDVKVNNGIVTLSGNAYNLMEKERAANMLEYNRAVEYAFADGAQQGYNGLAIK